MPTKDRRLTTGRRERPKRFISRERVGGSDPTNFLGAPAHFGVFSTVTFAFTASLSPTLQRNCARHRVKNLEKTKLKKVILTLFTCPVRILAAPPRRNTGDQCLSCTVHLSHTGKRPRKRKSSKTIFALASIRV